MAYIGLDIAVKGTDKMRRIYQAVGRPAFMQAVAGAVYAEALRIMRQAKRQVPLRDGPLRASGTVEEPRIHGWQWSIRLGFGGAAAAYALIQHENLTFYHPQPGRKAKYLEDPVRAALPGMQARLARSVANYFRAIG